MTHIGKAAILFHYMVVFSNIAKNNY